MVEPQRSTVRFDEASLGRDEPKTNRTRGKAREKPHRHPNGEVLLDNADAVIEGATREHGFWTRNIRGRLARSPSIDDIRHRALGLISLAGREGVDPADFRIEYRVFVEGQQGGKVGGHEADGLFAQQVIDGVDRAIGHEFHSQDPALALIPIFVGKQHGEVEGRQLVHLDIEGVLGEVAGEDGLQETVEDITGELGQDHGASDGAAAARESFGIDITAGPDGGFYPVDGDGQSRTLEQLLGHLSLEHSAHARQAPQTERERIADI